MGKFIYCFSIEDRDKLLAKGFEEIGTCKINGETVYSFENSPLKFATFSKENQGKILVTDVAYFV